MAVYHDVTLPTTTEPSGCGIKWTPADDEGGACLPIAGTMVISGRRNQCEYAVTEFPSAWLGRAFHLAKVTTGTDPEAESYSCFVASNGQDKQCECKGFDRHGRCKHLDALAALVANGWL